MRVLRALLATVAVAGTLLTATTAAEAATTTHWQLTYGASKAVGTIAWGDGRTAGVSGTIHAVSGFRQVCFWGINGGTSTPDTPCWATFPGVDTPFSDSLTINVPGGVNTIYLNFSDQYHHEFDQQRCTRSGCVAG
ncbi:hypothetical protein SAMN05421837_103860 [Amycolatopsis pretoriensis]|uniref:Uncharacterized protein n=1 Tax=Amycolatopsis pretoriensis TaxID=218821 RepID=A0A1H5QMS5_9PSEU|nr:hypothetical protein [Amycolatopsis pretoriensis]SEF27452.1 hypothetical protein SAMN05421837_103860 [Amycolatopsis pretoriensis]